MTQKHCWAVVSLKTGEEYILNNNFKLNQVEFKTDLKYAVRMQLNSFDLSITVNNRIIKKVAYLKDNDVLSINEQKYRIKFQDCEHCIALIDTKINPETHEISSDSDSNSTVEFTWNKYKDDLNTE